MRSGYSTKGCEHRARIDPNSPGCEGSFELQAGEFLLHARCRSRIVRSRRRKNRPVPMPGPSRYLLVLHLGQLHLNFFATSSPLSSFPGVGLRPKARAGAANVILSLFSVFDVVVGL